MNKLDFNMYINEVEIKVFELTGYSLEELGVDSEEFRDYYNKEYSATESIEAYQDDGGSLEKDEE